MLRQRGVSNMKFWFNLEANISIWTVKIAKIHYLIFDKRRFEIYSSPSFTLFIVHFTICQTFLYNWTIKKKKKLFRYY